MEKIEISRQQEEFLQVFGREINKTYVFFPKIYKKLGERQYQEVSLKDLPKGIQEYIKKDLEI